MASTLSDKITGLLNAAPTSYDPEDDLHEETSARVVANTVITEDSDDEIIGKFRKQNVELLEDVDKRYKGKRATRKALDDDDWSDVEDDTGFSTDTHGLQDDYNDSEVSDILEDSDSNESKPDTFTHIDEPDASVQITKGQCVRQQLNMWENLLEMRIQLQKCLITGNKLPQPSVLPELKRKHTPQLTETTKILTDLLDKLLHLQVLLIRKYPETKSLLSGSGSSAATDDEVITSDSDGDDAAKDVPRKKRKLNYASELGKRHDLYKNYRDSVIQKWNDKTRIANTKSPNSSNSVVKQIDHILSDKEKLIKRSQLCRNDYGKNVDDSDEVYCAEVYDDTDFYHQLLRELIEYKSADLTDPVQLGRQWIQLQNLRSKMKRKIDTRATKGRKIRYAVHSKLVNFMAAVDDITWQNDAKTELYNSLFGKGQPVNKV